MGDFGSPCPGELEMVLRGVFNEEFCKLISDFIRDPIIVILLLLTLLVTTLLKNICFPSPNPIVDIIIVFEDFWIIMFAIKYSVKIVVEVYTEILSKAKQLR